MEGKDLNPFEINIASVNELLEGRNPLVSTNFVEGIESTIQKFHIVFSVRSITLGGG